ncbi:MAG: hypothetical protein AB7U85_06250 [Alphaproteobacteria bacterium]
MRRFLLYILPLILPSLIYFGWKHLKQLSGRKDEKTALSDVPWAILIIIGAILAIVFLGFFTMGEKAPTSAKYEPPRYEDGKLIPAKMKY